ncbi:hypothetical protein DFH06DRAFT_1237455 [Mycena polygramma]|nr:hypothetical protein DFH06DRAFT_1237455 [Mycena polygramma]
MLSSRLFPMAKSTLSPSSAPLAGGFRYSWPRSASFDCPDTDKDGASLTGQGLSTGANSNGNGSSSQTEFTCTYRDGAGTCAYDEVRLIQWITVESCSSQYSEWDISIRVLCMSRRFPRNDSNVRLESLVCSAHSFFSVSSSTQVVTETQTQVVTKTPPPPSASPTSSPPRSNTSTAVPTSAFSSENTAPSPSNTDVAIPVSSTSMSQSTNTGLPIVGGSKKSLTGGAIAGIVLGVLALLALVGLILVRQARKRRRSGLEELQPESYFIVNQTSNTRPQPSNRLKSAVTSPSDRTANSDLVQSRQEYLTTQLREVQKRLEAVQSSAGNSTHLEEAREENEALRARIRMLEGEMQSQWGRGLSDSPPAYLD